MGDLQKLWRNVISYPLLDLFVFWHKNQRALSTPEHDKFCEVKRKWGWLLCELINLYEKQGNWAVLSTAASCMKD